ncbi:uncharacterized protein LOC132736712 [Ruditapes philippinarum]|uniref:uncharacterized protein LOC132736712 n=1 Tax=Ruditapes philippinarum TaxID=129788 RepID=UPI00295B2E3D|nr:uncharacterized protein LOC132736712 [Ruditapes philippinarum]
MWNISLTLVMMCIVLQLTNAQFGGFRQYSEFRDPEWLMDDPHKSDRLPMWNYLFGNRGFRSHGRTMTHGHGGSQTRNLNGYNGRNTNFMSMFMSAANFDY